MIVPVILAGGSGSRLWPLSRSSHPKQFLSLTGGQQTLLQETLLRTQGIESIAPPFIICNQEHRFLVAMQLQQLGLQNASILLEPVGKNTAPAAALAALALLQRYEDPLLLILPADHILQSVPIFHDAVKEAVQAAKENLLVTFGVTPHRPETGYGYIKVGQEIKPNTIFSVEQFIEKPDAERAHSYLLSGQYYWNSGMFMFRARHFIQELETHAPDMLQACQKIVRSMQKDLDFIRVDSALFAECPSDSIDYAVMEKTQNAALIPLRAAWNDIGSWAALWEANPPDENGNVIQGDVVLDAVSHSYLRAESRMLAVVGVTDHIIIETADAVLVAHKNSAQAVKVIVEQLKQKQRIETALHKKVYRPWGYYEILNQGAGFQVKRLTVFPGASLSLQAHQHRSEHWIVVSGMARVRCGEKDFIIAANESTYIPCGVKHKLSNPHATALEVIEVQSGHYLGEDDIVRFEENAAITQE